MGLGVSEAAMQARAVKDQAREGRPLTAVRPAALLFLSGFLIGAQREFCRAWPNQQTVTVKGAHFLQEDSPREVGEASARFVAKVLAGQIAA